MTKSEKEVNYIEATFPNYPMWYKVRWVSKYGDVTEEVAKQMLQDYQTRNSVTV